MVAACDWIRPCNVASWRSYVSPRARSSRPLVLASGCCSAGRGGGGAEASTAAAAAAAAPLRASLGPAAARTRRRGGLRMARRRVGVWISAFWCMGRGRVQEGGREVWARRTSNTHGRSARHGNGAAPAVCGPARADGAPVKPAAGPIQYMSLLKSFVGLARAPGELGKLPCRGWSSRAIVLALAWAPGRPAKTTMR
jgi:hypothetical protein